MKNILAFLEGNGCDKKLAKLIGEIIPSAVKKIRDSIQTERGGLAGSSNVYGEKQLALDVVSNQIILDELKSSGLVATAASEEMEELVHFHPKPSTLNPLPYTVVFDPLDGSSLVDVNLAVGSIFGIYGDGDLIGKNGDAQVASCYAVYGPRTTLVLTVKKGAHEFSLSDDGNFYLSRENLKLAEKAKHFAPGNLRAAAELPKYLELTNDWIRKGLTLRYSGGMVPDINHILIKGNGIFSYPAYSKAPKGKLRLLFECNPLSLITEQAGGKSTDGNMRILAKKIEELHQRTPIYIGSSGEVNRTAESLGGL